MKNMGKAKVVMLNLGDAQYPQDYLNNIIDELRREVGKMNLDLIACHSIMCGEDVQNVEKDLKGKEIDLIITNFVSWHITPYIMSVLKNYRDIPLLIWGIGGTVDKTGKLQSPAAAAAITSFIPIIRELGFKYEIICEKPDEPHRYADVERFVHLVASAKKIKNARIGLIGYADMGLYSCAYDKTGIFKKLGVDIEDYSGYEITKMMAECPKDELDKIITDIKKNMIFENKITDKALENVSRLYYAMKNKADGRELDAISIKCVHGTTSILGFNPCLAQSLLANKDLSVICECDAYGLMTSIILSTITDNASAFMENYEVYDNEVLVGACGFIPAEFAESVVKIRSANLGEYIDGISNVSKLKSGEVTFGRFYNGDGKFKLFLSKGLAQPTPKWTEMGWAEPTPDFPSTLLKLEIPMDKYIENVPGQHIIMVYGDYIEQVKKVCYLLDIEVVM